MNQARGESEQHEAATHLVNPGGQIEDDLELGPDQRHGVLRPPAATASKSGNQESALHPPPPRGGGRKKRKTKAGPRPRPRDGTSGDQCPYSPGEAAAEGGVPAAVRPREALQHHGGTLATRERSGRAREGGRGSSAGAPDADQPTDRPNPSPAGASPSAGTQPAAPDYMGAGGREPRPHAGAGREAEPEEEIWCEGGCGESGAREE